MKRFFISAIVTMSCFMANAQTISIPAVNLAPGGEKTVSVSLANATDYTAFQFDIALPTGVTVTNAVMDNKPNTREIKTGTVNGKYRVLSYDNGNAKFTSGSVLSLTFKAAEGTALNETEAGVSTIVVVKDDGTGPGEATGSVAIKVKNGVEITIPAGGKLLMASDFDLDFSSLESQGVKAYICTGYEIDGGKDKFWLTRVNDVPANTQIMVKGDAGTYTVPTGVSRIYYPQNFLTGSATESTTVDWNGYKNFVVSTSTGTIGSLSNTYTSVDPNKFFFHVPTSENIPSSVATSQQSFTMEACGKLMCVSNYDLDFSNVDGLKAYTATGFDLDSKIYMTRVMKASANTPLQLRGTAGTTYNVPSSAKKASYISMLTGNSSNSGMSVTPTMDGNTLYVMSKSSGKFGTLGQNATMDPGKAWMLVPTWFVDRILSAATSRGLGGSIVEVDAEVICLESIGGDDDDTTGIRELFDDMESDIWYNLKGQRIDTPNKKGLYIKNGKKVVVK